MRKHRGDLPEDRLAADHGVPEVAVCNAGQELAVLHQQRLVQAALLAKRSQRFRGRLVAQNDQRRIGRHHPHDKEHDGRNGHRHQQQREKPSQQETQHQWHP
jgi:hypothetical protein